MEGADIGEGGGLEGGEEEGQSRLWLLLRDELRNRRTTQMGNDEKLSRIGTSNYEEKAKVLIENVLHPIRPSIPPRNSSLVNPNHQVHTHKPPEVDHKYKYEAMFVEKRHRLHNLNACWWLRAKMSLSFESQTRRGLFDSNGCKRTEKSLCK